MASLPNRPEYPQHPPSERPAWPWTQALLIVLIAAAAVYLISNHWLHILDALPYLGVVLMMGMHLFMHGGHGGHGAHGGSAQPESSGGPATGPEVGGGAGHVH